MAQSTLTDLSACVAEFHDAFQIGNNHSPNRLGTEEQVLRYSLMREENEEYLEAAQQGRIKHLRLETRKKTKCQRKGDLELSLVYEAKNTSKNIGD
jgi:hypothetical protein